MAIMTVGARQLSFEVAEAVVIADPYDIDPMVVLGCEPGRNLSDMTLRIGPGARLRSGTVLYAGSSIGANLETGHHVVIREQNVLGDDVSIWNNSVIDYGCSIGNRVKIHCNIYLAQFTTIEDDVFLAPGVSTANDPHPICTRCMRGPTIKRGARIGVNVTLLPHITIGEGAVIGAGSVVTHDVPDFMVAYGNPARAVKHVDELTCFMGLEERPYLEGMDVRTQRLMSRV